MTRLSSWRERLWRALCRLLVGIFYRRVEVDHRERIPDEGGVLVCANHLNSMVDVIVLQAVLPRHLSPLARSGHFSNPSMWPLLSLSGALPIYRPQDRGSDPAKNADTFASCHKELGRGGGILIFPEGESHSDPRLKPLKTGAARIALGTLAKTGQAPLVVPASLAFSRRGTFRSSVLIQVGEPVPVDRDARIEDEAAVRRLTASIQAGLAKITLSAESWEDVDFLNRIDRFFEQRRGRRPEARPLAQRFRALQRLIERHRHLRLIVPEKVASVRHKLRRFQRLCKAAGAKDHDLDVRYRARSMLSLFSPIFLAAALFPLALWGGLTSGIPYLLTRTIAPRLARRPDQLATSKVLFGLVLLSLWWFAVAAVSYRDASLEVAIAVSASLPVGAAAALFLLGQRVRLIERVRALLGMRTPSETRRYLLSQRRELEVEIAELARIAKRLEWRDDLRLAS